MFIKIILLVIFYRIQDDYGNLLIYIKKIRYENNMSAKTRKPKQFIRKNA